MGLAIVMTALALGWMGFAGWLVWWGFDEREMFPVAVGAIMAVVGAGMILAFIEDRDDPHLVLNETEWACTGSDMVLVPVLVGKVIINQPRRVCVQYSRRG